MRAGQLRRTRSRTAAGSRRAPAPSHRRRGGARGRGPLHRRILLFTVLLVVHLASLAALPLALGWSSPRGVATTAEDVVDTAVDDVVGKAGDVVELAGEVAARPDLQPMQAPFAESPVPERASGRFDVAPLTAAARRAGARADRMARPSGTDTRAGAPGVLTYRVEVERGLPYTADEFARAVARTLADPRGWTASPEHRGFRQVTGAADFRIVLASPDRVDELCAPLTTEGRVSCRNGDDVVINAWRWWRGAKSYGDDVAAYRTYVVNHEVGHYLGHGHVGCPGKGKPAPVMHQQTLGLAGCTANPWPTPGELR